MGKTSFLNNSCSHATTKEMWKDFTEFGLLHLKKKEGANHSAHKCFFRGKMQPKVNQYLTRQQVDHKTSQTTEVLLYCWPHWNLLSPNALERGGWRTNRPCLYLVGLWLWRYCAWFIFMLKHFVLFCAVICSNEIENGSIWKPNEARLLASGSSGHQSFAKPSSPETSYWLRNKESPKTCPANANTYDSNKELCPKKLLPFWETCQSMAASYWFYRIKDTACTVPHALVNVVIELFLHANMQVNIDRIKQVYSTQVSHTQVYPGYFKLYLSLILIEIVVLRTAATSCRHEMPCRLGPHVWTCSPQNSTAKWRILRRDWKTIRSMRWDCKKWRKYRMSEALLKVLGFWFLYQHCERDEAAKTQQILCSLGSCRGATSMLLSNMPMTRISANKVL